MIKEIHTDQAPAAIGPYSQAIDTGDIVFFSGQIGLDPATGKLAPDVKAQTKQALENIKALLESMNLSFSNVVKTTCYLADIADFKTMNDIYATYFKKPYPARSALEIGALPANALVEIEVVVKK